MCDFFFSSVIVGTVRSCQHNSSASLAAVQNPVVSTCTCLTVRLWHWSSEQVFIEDRKQHAEQGFPPKGVFEREVAELMGNIQMFGDHQGYSGPWSSVALEYAQQFRSEFGFSDKDPAAAGGVRPDSQEEQGYLGDVMKSPAKFLSGISKRIW